MSYETNPQTLIKSSVEKLTIRVNFPTKLLGSATLVSAYIQMINLSNNSDVSSDHLLNYSPATIENNTKVKFIINNTQTDGDEYKINIIPTDSDGNIFLSKLLVNIQD